MLMGGTRNDGSVLVTGLEAVLPVAATSDGEYKERPNLLGWLLCLRGRKPEGCAVNLSGGRQCPVPGR